MRAKQEAYRIIGLQCIMVSSLALAMCFYHVQWAKDVLLGGLAAILPNIFFAYRLFTKVYKAKNPSTALYVVIVQKMVLSIAMLLVFMQMTPRVFILMSGFLMAYLGLWLSPLLLTRSD